MDDNELRATAKWMQKVWARERGQAYSNSTLISLRDGEQANEENVEWTDSSSPKQEDIFKD